MVYINIFKNKTIFKGASEKKNCENQQQHRKYFLWSCAFYNSKHNICIYRYILVWRGREKKRRSQWKRWREKYKLPEMK